jgi:hypothetical protein
VIRGVGSRGPAVAGWGERRAGRGIGGAFPWRGRRLAPAAAEGMRAWELGFTVRTGDEGQCHKFLGAMG